MAEGSNFFFAFVDASYKVSVKQSNWFT